MSDEDSEQPAKRDYAGILEYQQRKARRRQARVFEAILGCIAVIIGSGLALVGFPCIFVPLTEAGPLSEKVELICYSLVLDLAAFFFLRRAVRIFAGRERDL